MKNDTGSFSFVEQCVQNPFIHQILKIQRFEKPRPKSFQWMQNLRCLSPSLSSSTARGSLCKHTDSKAVLHEEYANLFDTQHFRNATISYSSRPARFESGKSGSFSIVKLDGTVTKNNVRDTIIRRAIRYVQHHKIRGFWIDDECLDPSGHESRELAIHSMDRLYAESPHSVGMLTVSVDEQWKLDALYSLMDGSLFEAANDPSDMQEHPRMSSIRFWRVLKWFLRLLSDPWWTRCWIYQEEYCAGRNMWLLVPCKHDLNRRSSILGMMSDEIEVQATELRVQLTRFHAACMWDPRLNPKQKRFVRQKLRGKAERYQVSYQLDGHQGYTLSSKIMADLQQRRVKYPQDLLAISANCCSYARRLDQKRLDQERDVSLSLALFVQALMNGEILHNNLKVSNLPTRGFTQFFQQQMFKQVRPPLRMENLTFVKHCRFLDPHLCREGILTTGYLWEILGALPTGNARLEYLKRRPETPNGPHATNLTVLRELVTELAQAHPATAEHLDHFVLKMSSRGQLEDLFMTAMAEEVAWAWGENRPLIIGRLAEDHHSWGIFVPSSPHFLPQQVFSSWHNASDRVPKGPLEPIDKHVQLDVSSEPDASGRGVPRLRIKGWVNGLCFYGHSARQEVLFPWPESFAMEDSGKDLSTR